MTGICSRARLFRFDHHMARLERSLKECRIPNPHSRAEWAGIIGSLVTRYAASQGIQAEASDQLIYLQITRGVALRDHVMPADITPTVFVMTNAMKPVPAEQRSQGVACVTADDFRWEKAHIKSTSLLGAVFARQISFDAGAMETVMFRDGWLSEAAACNVWIVKDGKVIGTPKDNLVLEGIRYGLIEEICRAQGIGFELRRISRAEVLGADEVLLTSATKEVLAVTRLDGLPVGTGQPGPVYVRLYEGYQQAKAAT
jgi:D-alanine transaminase